MIRNGSDPGGTGVAGRRQVAMNRPDSDTDPFGPHAYD